MRDIPVMSEIVFDGSRSGLTSCIMGLEALYTIAIGDLWRLNIFVDQVLGFRLAVEFIQSNVFIRKLSRNLPDLTSKNGENRTYWVVLRYVGRGALIEDRTEEIKNRTFASSVGFPPSDGLQSRRDSLRSKWAWADLVLHGSKEALWY